MSEITTVPGGIPGLIRLFAPVTIGTFAGVVIATGPVLTAVGFLSPPNADPAAKDIPTELLNLILSEPVGRDIAARWMAEKLGLEVGLTAPRFGFQPAGPRGAHAFWYLEGDAWQVVFRAMPAFPGSITESDTRIIAGLQLDPTKGAEAMRLCVLHLAGRQA